MLVWDISRFHVKGLADEISNFLVLMDPTYPV